MSDLSWNYKNKKETASAINTKIIGSQKIIQIYQYTTLVNRKVLPSVEYNSCELTLSDYISVWGDSEVIANSTVRGIPTYQKMLFFHLFFG